MKPLTRSNHGGRYGQAGGLSGQDARAPGPDSDRGRLVRLGRPSVPRVLLPLLMTFFNWASLSIFAAEQITATTASQGTRFALAFRGQPLLVYEFSPS